MIAYSESREEIQSEMRWEEKSSELDRWSFRDQLQIGAAL